MRFALVLLPCKNTQKRVSPVSHLLRSFSKANNVKHQNTDSTMAITNIVTDSYNDLLTMPFCSHCKKVEGPPTIKKDKLGHFTNKNHRQEAWQQYHGIAPPSSCWTYCCQSIAGRCHQKAPVRTALSDVSKPPRIRLTLGCEINLNHPSSPKTLISIEFSPEETGVLLSRDHGLKVTFKDGYLLGSASIL